MTRFDRITVGRQARELGFVRDTFEKICRLALAVILKPEDTELSFWQAFAEEKYQPDFLFDDADIVSRIEHHPMALWKCGGMFPRWQEVPDTHLSEEEFA